MCQRNLEQNEETKNNNVSKKFRSKRKRTIMCQRNLDENPRTIMRQRNLDENEET